jgi:hypothetical protein
VRNSGTAIGAVGENSVSSLDGSGMLDGSGLPPPRPIHGLVYSPPRPGCVGGAQAKEDRVIAGR